MIKERIDTPLRLSMISPQTRSEKLGCAAILAMIAILMVLHLPLFIFMTEGRLVDYKFHMQLSYEIYEDFSFNKLLNQEYSSPLPHFGYHLQVATLYTLMPFLTQGAAAAFPMIMSSMLMGAILYVLARKCLTESTHSYGMIHFLSVGTSICLLLIDPIIIIPWGHPGLFYSGYLPINIYHNPTTNILKPWTLICTLIAVYLIANHYRYYADVMRRMVVAVFVSTMVTLTKPNYIICFLPVVFLIGSYSMIKHRRVSNALVWGALIAPAMLILIWQYWATYGHEVSSVAVGLFVAMEAQGVQHYEIFPKLIASIAFPVYVYVAFPQARRDLFLNFTWLLFLLGLFFTYTLYETGDRLGHGNFGWSGQLTLIGVFVASTIFLLRHYQKRLLLRQWRALPRAFYGAVLIFMLHLVSGVAYYGFAWYWISTNLK